MRGVRKMGYMEPEIRQEMIRDFVNESRELLDEVEPQIIELEQMVSTAGSIDEGLLNGVFRNNAFNFFYRVVFF